ncbi:1,4-alpha-glucan branching protein GlgB [Thermodesulfovibrio yellowstonii]|uniref:1,4-alpha-glucan branching enzyme GlgB n=1 Tax=Thermodesulfovibrio yellowstonii (strain ATCC 51303 / DSM 11347 / YP87) TaxID=289376 RepID=B5YHB1_THEYD|nr:1,4-alpha-glucan branching protein GlgB [Thermodesulfovibrio yellowstonii]ACI20861.1 1,4-alpha-glucan branching enzyme [Thermodesulfovibrio yellowstonii DSM 11347]MDI6865477.1 1,4-alpha-glucan branching protein GlgB [Thermodesulfovibrio yellowstonii]
MVRYDITFFSDFDIYLFKEGNHFNAYEKLGSHIIEVDGKKGTYFAVWAPNAERVYVIGDFNGWELSHPLSVRWDNSGIWEGFIPEIDKGTKYKYYIISKYGYHLEKGDPYAFFWEIPPATASIVWDLEYKWNDEEWMKNRVKRNGLNCPISIYEVHLGSWRRVPEQGNRFLTYRELAEWLPKYVKDMGFTHVEFLPVMEHPFYGSWGYQTIGYFAPTSRYGTPQDFMYLIDKLHQNEIGVILDWVPSHFPDDGHGLSFFDGTYLYEHQDPKKGYHPHWHSYIFNHGRNEIRNFLISSAVFWLDKYHIDGLRVDAVASMLYLDYGRAEGEWIPNKYGGKENLEAIEFIKRLNETVYEKYPDTQTIAEESTAWPLVTHPTYIGGLGFGMKWNMGWMHDTLYYFSKDPIYRKYHHGELTFSIWYAFSENFVLPLSHDEVVYGKSSLLNKMPGDQWQKFANLRLLFGYMYAHPGKKLLFMGGEFGQWDEWYHEGSLHWHLLDYPEHQGIQKLVRDLNNLYKTEPALHELDFSPAGFEWIDCSDADQSVVSFLRKAKDPKNVIIVVCNFTPVPRFNYRIGVPFKGYWREILNSDSWIYGGTNHGNTGGVEADQIPCHGRPYSLCLTLPPLGILFLKCQGIV